MLPAIVFLLLQTQVPAPQPLKPEPLPPARIELTTPFPVHLGSVGPRERREALFGIRSTHDRAFRFRVLDLSLGLKLDETQLREPLQPGEVREIRVRVDPTGLEGFIKGAVRLGTDDPAQPNYILRYDMMVRPEVTVDSVRKSLGDVEPHESPEVQFRFTREGGDPLRVTLTGDLPAHLDAALANESASSELRIKLRPHRLKPGTTAGLEVLKVTTNAPKQPLFTLYLDWRIVTPVVPTPSRLVFDDLKTTLLGLELTARDGRPFSILKVDIRGQGFQVLDAPGFAASRHVLRIRRTGKVSEAMLEILSSNMDGPLRVPLRFLDPRISPPKTMPPPAQGNEGHHH